MYVMDQFPKWEDYIHMFEFDYNNNNYESLKMSPFEVLQGRKCHNPLHWTKEKYILVSGYNLLQEMENTV